MELAETKGIPMQIPVPGLLVAGPTGPDNLRLEQHLGGGAFGVVFKASDTITREAFAVKFPQAAVFGGEPEMVAFLNEVQAAQEIRHENVVRVVYAAINPAHISPYLVMEFLGDGTLGDRISSYREADTQVPIASLRLWSSGLIDGITAINARMLHRDLKPDNIMMDGNVPKIADFGLSKIIGAATRSRTFKGGQHMLYMAPEGWKLESNDIQLDMYAMGIVLFEAATLRYPYDLPRAAGDLAALRDMHLFQSPLSLPQLRPDLPIGFCQVVSRLMAKRPQDRFSTWSEVKSKLDEAWSTTDESTDTPSMLSRVLQATQEAYETATKQRLEQEQELADREQQHRLDTYQKYQLLQIFDGIIDQFNSHNAHGNINAQWRSIPRDKLETITYRHLNIELPYGRSLILEFFPIDPPLNLRRGQVRFAAFLGAFGGTSLNCLLCRRDDDDLYGEWLVCQTRMSGLVREPVPRPEPFGFRTEHMKEIERGDQAAHIYVPEFSESVKDAFLRIIRDAILQQDINP